MDDRDDLSEAEVGSSGSVGRFDFLQPRRDLQSNWEVDLAKNLEEYLLKICSGEVPTEQSVNFAEAALLLQGSVQVYSRKVEYLYTLVLRVLEFISQKRQDEREKVHTVPDDNINPTPFQDEDDAFLGLDDVPVGAKNCLDDSLNRCGISNHFARAPTNLLVFEGDCLDSTGEANELESYLLATCDIYGDFLLLDPCDAGGVDSFLQKNASKKDQVPSHRNAPSLSKTHKNVFQSLVGGGSSKSSLRKAKNFSATESLEDDPTFEPDSADIFSDSGPSQNRLEEPHFVCQDAQDDFDEDEDPWEPLNPHEPGNLKIKPFQKGRNLRTQVNPIFRRKNQSTQFPLAKLDGIISSELADSFEVKVRLKETQNASESPALYEKLRGSLSFGNHGSFDFLDVLGSEDHNEVENDLPDFDQSDYEMGMEAPSFGKERDTPRKYGAGHSSLDELHCSPNLEDLCKSHLDALLATIAESEKQSELAARVSTWKQRIEQTIEEHDQRPAFDIHLYGEKILEKMSQEADDGGSMTFTDVVAGQPKHEVARTFSALLQLVNDGNVDLQRHQSNSVLVCHTAKNPFHIKLRSSGRRKVQVCIHSAKKRVASPLKSSNDDTSPLRSNEKLSIRLKNGGLNRHAPEGKRGRRSGFGKRLHSAANA